DRACAESARGSEGNELRRRESCRVGEYGLDEGGGGTRGEGEKQESGGKGGAKEKWALAGEAQPGGAPTVRENTAKPKQQGVMTGLSPRFSVWRRQAGGEGGARAL